MLKRLAWVLAALFAFSAVSPGALAGGRKGGGGSRSGSSRSSAPHSSRSYGGPSSKSRGYYRGPTKPSGTFKNGEGSSHKGGTYKNNQTGDRYQKRK
jgi:hypothetical protein